MIGPSIPSLKNLCLQTIHPLWKEETENVDESLNYTKYFYNDRELPPYTLALDLISDIKIASLSNKCFVVFQKQDKDIFLGGYIDVPIGDRDVPFDLSQTISEVKDVAAACLKDYNSKHNTYTPYSTYIKLGLHSDIYPDQKEQPPLKNDQKLGERYKPGDIIHCKVIPAVYAFPAPDEKRYEI